MQTYANHYKIKVVASCANTIFLYKKNKIVNIIGGWHLLCPLKLVYTPLSYIY